METTKIAIFKGRKIRKIFYNNEWWFSVVDVVQVFTDSANSRDYWFKMKIRVKREDSFEPSTICRQLKLAALDGKTMIIKVYYRFLIWKNKKHPNFGEFKRT